MDSELTTALQAACRAAFDAARRARPGERFYAFGLWCDGRDLLPAASTEEALRGLPAVARWRPALWSLLGARGRALTCRPDAPARRARGAARARAGAGALRALDEEGRFGRDEERAAVVVAVLTADQTAEELVGVARGLNPPEVVERLAREVGARPDALGRGDRTYAVHALACAGDLVAAVTDDEVSVWDARDGARLRPALAPRRWRSRATSSSWATRGGAACAACPCTATASRIDLPGRGGRRP
ncbi:MAG: hypothetical protein KF878_11295 [Planctomycetes bacterium]|nr:hypothetical protein [Planctomycetota bacterium]